jgi:hypothetical protein
MLDLILAPPAINVALTLIAAFAVIPWLRDVAEVSRTIVTDLGLNSDEDAKAHFLNLLEEATSEVIMYDDGDLGQESIYQSADVIAALRQKLERFPGFVVRCELNHLNGETRFERELQHSRVFISGRAAEDRTHYKVFDRKKAYVSRHGVGETARNRRLIDCTNAPSRKPELPPIALRPYIEDFEQNAAVAVA